MYTITSQNWSPSGGRGRLLCSYFFPLPLFTLAPLNDPHFVSCRPPPKDHSRGGSFRHTKFFIAHFEANFACTLKTSKKVRPSGPMGGHCQEVRLWGTEEIFAPQTAKLGTGVYPMHVFMGSGGEPTCTHTLACALASTRTYMHSIATLPQSLSPASALVFLPRAIDAADLRGVWPE